MEHSTRDQQVTGSSITHYVPLRVYGPWQAAHTRATVTAQYMYYLALAQTWR